MPLSASQTDFLNNIWPWAQSAGQQTGIDPSVIAAQAALESGWGQHAPQNNYFGIKGPGGTETTQENIGGVWQAIQAHFQGYSSLGDSVQGWADLISGNPRYASVLNAGDAQSQIQALGASGYATDPNYGSKLASVWSEITNGFNPSSDGGSGSAGSGFPRGHSERRGRLV